ncbi:hypothetical protein CC1G_09664 [Coprinopsis cinerea okayama7|uniref:Cytochrome P450 n=1 Tax=Coprinopsis cinerea (strain Okayama-7 / 130 / ATCC MYA-4618 / FGSC 9003) TaxID=240176 RepID=A8P9F5_COPC7|nr:hypothetical protein CC1G_09664 [Coprinopsis cinerea okayama7\|eukprot:XP_001839761.2 hypothetical protein CC1G_09664 [Coprinopsis cinerea okayama7\
MATWDELLPVSPASLAAVIAVVGASLFYCRTNRRNKTDNIPTLPTWFPWIGIDNALRLFFNPTSFLEEMRKQHGPLFQFTVLASRIIVLQHPYNLRALERQSRALSEHLPIEVVAKASSELPNPNRITNAIMTTLSRIVEKEFSSGRMKVTGLRSRFHEALGKEMDRLVQAPNINTQIPLCEFIRETIYRASCVVVFGPSFPIQTYADFKSTGGQLDFLSTWASRMPWSKAGGARRRVIEAIAEYVRPWWESSGMSNERQISDFMVESLTAMRECGLSLQESASAILCYLWGFHNNLWFHLYWTFVHILADNETLTAVEIEARDSGNLGRRSLIQSAIWEAMRWPYLPQQVRRASEDLNVCLEGIYYWIPKGTWILSKSFNHDSRVYEDPFEFKVDRFYNNPSLPKPKGFGDGVHTCKGMHFALHEMEDHIVTSFRKFDIKLLKRSRGDRTIPQSEANAILPDISKFEDFTLELHPRA